MNTYANLHQIHDTQLPFIADLVASPWGSPETVNLAQVASVLGLGRGQVDKAVQAGLIPTVVVPGYSARRVTLSTLAVLEDSPWLALDEITALGDDTLVIRVGGPQLLDQPDPFDRSWFGYGASMPRRVALSGTLASWLTFDWAGPQSGPATVDAPMPTTVRRALIVVSGFVVEDVAIIGRVDEGVRTAFIGRDHDQAFNGLVGSRVPGTGFPGPVLPAAQWSLKK